MKKNYILSLTIIICIILAIIVLVNGRNNKKDNENLKGYTQVKEVDGSSFYINSEFIDRATAVVEISDSVNFEKNQFYSYSNGSDKYQFASTRRSYGNSVRREGKITKNNVEYNAIMPQYYMKPDDEGRTGKQYNCMNVSIKRIEGDHFIVYKQ